MNHEEHIAQLQAQIKDLEHQLLQAQKLSSVGTLATAITHEFNNILTTTINYAKMGVRHQDAPTRDKAFEKILAASQRAAKITTSLLSYARNKADRTDVMSLSLLVSDLLVLVEKDLQKYRVQLETHYDEHIFADVNASQIQQVLMNLVINARQAIKERGQITVSVTKSSDQKWAQISVKDTGCGIPKESLPKIFDQFYTTKSADEHGQGGTGIGLALCKQIIESHKGRIRVESTPGQGTTFTLKLPLTHQPGLAKSNPVKATTPKTTPAKSETVSL